MLCTTSFNRLTLLNGFGTGTPRDAKRSVRTFPANVMDCEPRCMNIDGRTSMGRIFQRKDRANFETRVHRDRSFQT